MYLIVFRSKNETIKFSSLIASYGYKSALVPTPRQISVSCGLSARVDARTFEIAKLILKQKQFFTFLGIYQINKDFYTKL